MEHLTFNVQVPRREAALAGKRPFSWRAAARSPVARFTRRMVSSREPYDWDYLWMLAFTALLFVRPQDHVPALESLHLAEVTAILGLAAMAVRRLGAGQTIAKINPEVLGLVVLGAIVLLTIPFSSWPGGSLAVFSEIYVKIVLIFALMIGTITTPRRLQQMTWLMILASGYIAGRGVIDYLSGVNLVEGDRLGGAVGGMFKNPNDLALNLVTFLAPTLFVIIQDERMTKRLVAVPIAMLMLIATVFTKSRSGFLGLLAMGAVIVYYTVRIKPGIVLAVVLAGVLALPAMPASFWHRMDSIVNAEMDPTGSRAARIRLFNQAIWVFADNPITGIGAGQFQNYNAPGTIEKWRVTHNVWLQVATELGIFGLATFAFLVARAYSACFATRRALDGARRRRRFTWQLGANHTAPVERVFAQPSGVDHRSAIDQNRAIADRQSGTLSDDDRRILEMNAKSMLAGLVGWTVCAFFASVAFNWTFYYVLALAVAGREIAVRQSARRARPDPGSRHPAVARGRSITIRSAPPHDAQTASRGPRLPLHSAQSAPWGPRLAGALCTPDAVVTETRRTPARRPGTGRA
jgi:putative inorganic carbon (HCO3(-)) transporter